MSLSSHCQESCQTTTGPEPFGFDLAAICHALTELTSMATTYVCERHRIGGDAASDLAHFFEALGRNQIDLARAISASQRAKGH